MKIEILSYRDWTFEYNKQLTLDTYARIRESGAESCNCNDCKNYIANRDKVFPDEILKLFRDLGIDFTKEVEITNWERKPNGLHHIGGWFHFKGKVIRGKNFKIPLPSGGFSIDLTPISDNFSIGFSEGNDLTFFEDKNELVQIEFDTSIPWIIDKELEDE